MLLYVLVVYSAFLLNEFDLVQNSVLRIPLYRQKTPRENALKSNNMMEPYGVYLNWLRKPHKNHTNDSVALFRFLDTEFYGVVQIGKKGQRFRMVFDTAWQDSWVLSSECSWRTIGCWFHNKYDHTISSTYVENGTKFSVSGENFNLTGYWSNDTILVGHSRLNHTLFVEITSVPYTYLFGKSEGVIGLGLPTAGRVDPFFNALVRKKIIKEPIFSIYLNRDLQSNRGGNIILGMVDSKHIHQIGNTSEPMPITYLPVDGSRGYWEFKMDRVALEDTAKNKSYGFCMSTSCTAFIDSSTNIIMGPKDDVDTIHRILKAKYIFFGKWRVNCDTANKLPPIDFILAGKNFTLKGDDYVQRMSFSSVTFCFSAFIGSKDLKDTWILGGAFLSQYYSIYDIANTRIGFVLAA